MAVEAAAAALSTTQYRIWLYTAPLDEGSAKGQLNLCLGGALGSKWLMRVDAAIPADELYGAGQQCEFLQEAEDVGTLHTLVVEYGYAVSDHLATNPRLGMSDASLSNTIGTTQAPGITCDPWMLSHIIIRNATTGMVYHFPYLEGRLVSAACTGTSSAPDSHHPRLAVHYAGPRMSCSWNHA